MGKKVEVKPLPEWLVTEIQCLGLDEAIAIDQIDETKPLYTVYHDGFIVLTDITVEEVENLVGLINAIRHSTKENILTNIALGKTYESD